MQSHFVEVSIKGKIHKVPVVRVSDRTIFAEGTWLKIASIHGEDWQAAEVQEPGMIIDQLRKQPLRADIFTFTQKPPHTTPKFKYPMMWDNIAAISITTFDEWWNRLSQDTRRNVRLATKRGVVLSCVPFSDELVHGIVDIYNETPFRNGRQFWHYGKDFQTVKRENSSYLDRSQFIAAHCGSELIGFIKLVYLDKLASIMQILSKNRHQDKRPMNALIAKAVEVCGENGSSHLIYCKYVYGKNRSSSLTEFKRRNGFEQILLPRYYIPLTLKGRLAMKLNIHSGIKEVLPQGLTEFLLRMRTMYYERVTRRRVQVTNKPASVH